MTLTSTVKQVFYDAASIVAPFKCHRCKAPTNFNVVLCDNCKAELIKALHVPLKVSDVYCPFDVYTMSSYDSMVSELVKIIKYKPSKKTVGIVAKACIVKARLKDFFTKNDVLVPVPMHSSRLSERGFNQAEALAKAFSKATNTPCCQAIIRKRATRAQADCTEKERLTNLDNAFALSKYALNRPFYGRRIILIDDVATTGTTLAKCAESLKLLKPHKICALVVSHPYKHFCK